MTGERPPLASDELFDEAAVQISGQNLLVVKTSFILCVNYLRALLECAQTIIEPTVDYGFHETREF